MFENIDWWNVLAGFMGGSAFGSLITYSVQKKKISTHGSGNAVDQSGARAGRNIAGRDNSS